ncbi:hypothetical protein D9M72_583180 [compost metagenome]
MADAFLLVATDFFPFLVGVGEEPHYVMDHASHSSCFYRRPPVERLRANAAKQVIGLKYVSDLMSQYREEFPQRV